MRCCCFSRWLSSPKKHPWEPAVTKHGTVDTAEEKQKVWHMRAVEKILIPEARGSYVSLLEQHEKKSLLKRHHA